MKCPSSSMASTSVRKLYSRFRRSEEHTAELQSPCNLVCRLLLEKKKQYDDRQSVPALVHSHAPASEAPDHQNTNVVVDIGRLASPCRLADTAPSAGDGGSHSHGA